MGKKVLTLLLVVSMAFSAAFPVFASEKVNTLEDSNSEIHLFWVNTDTVRTDLEFSGTRADCSCVIHAKDGTSKITATAYLKRVNSNGTTTVKAWTGLSASGDTFDFDGSYYVASGYTYEFELDAGITRNGVTEYISVTDSDYCG